MTADPIRIPVEVTTPPPIFDLVQKGYDRTQVDEHLLRLEQEIAELTWQREWVEGRQQQVEREEERLRTEREEWEAERDAWEPSFAKLGERANEIIRLTREEADALLDAARREAEERRARDQAAAEEAREAFGQESAEARARLRSELDLMRREAEAEVQQMLHVTRQKAAALQESARHDAETIRLRAMEHLAAARQERAKAATLLADLSQRLHTVSQRLSEDNDDLVRRLVVLTVPPDDGVYDTCDRPGDGSTQIEPAQIQRASIEPA